MYYSMSDWKLLGFKKSQAKNKKYSAILENKTTKKVRTVNFGDIRYQNFHDKTGLNLYPDLLHGDKKRRKSYRSRARVNLRKGFYSPSFFSFYYLW